MEWQFLALSPPVFLHLKHCSSFIHLAHSMGVSLDKVMASISIALGSHWGWEENFAWEGALPVWRA